MENKRRNVRNAATRNIEVVKWVTLEPGWVKVNVDASVYVGANSFAVGMMLRDVLGMFVQGRNMRVRGEVSVMEAEAFGVSEALNWIEINDYKQVIIENDSLLVVEAIRRDSNYQAEVGNVLESCREKLKHRNDVMVCHVKKQANKAVHLLARYPYLLDSSNVFMSPPEMLLDTLFSDISFE